MKGMKKSVVLAMAFAAFATVGCSNMSARDKNTAVGAAIGGVAGSNIGGGRGSIVGAIVGAVIGGMAGSAAEENLTKKNALEITVRLDNGQTVAVVQEMGDVFHPGQRVRVLSDYHSSRVTH